MRLLFRQRLFSWFDSYDIYDEAGNTVGMLCVNVDITDLRAAREAMDKFLLQDRMFSWTKGRRRTKPMPKASATCWKT